MKKVLLSLYSILVLINAAGIFYYLKFEMRLILIPIGLTLFYGTILYLLIKNKSNTKLFIITDFSLTLLYLPVSWLHFNFMIFPTGQLLAKFAGFIPMELGGFFLPLGVAFLLYALLAFFTLRNNISSD